MVARPREGQMPPIMENASRCSKRGHTILVGNLRPFLILIAAFTISCGEDFSLRKVNDDQYASDPSCWGGKENRFKGAGVFSGDEGRIFFLLSNRCIKKGARAKWGVFEDLIDVRLSDTGGILQNATPGNPKIWENYITDIPTPTMDEHVYLADIETKTLVSMGFKYMEITKIHRLQKTSLTYGDLFREYEGSMQKLRALENAK